MRKATQSQQQNAARIGRSSEHLVIAWLLRNTDTWVTQMPDSSGIDLLVQRTVNTARTYRLQVKTVFFAGGYRAVNLCRTDGSKYTERELDWIVAVDLDSQTFWMLPTHLTQKFGRLRLTAKYSGYAHRWDDAPGIFAWGE
jgi:hypothetical protein